MSKKQTKKTASSKTKPAKKVTSVKAAATAKRSPARNHASTETANAGAAGSRAVRGGAMPAPGTVIRKLDRYGAVRCECTVEDGGIRYGRNLYRSLSAAAMAAAKDLELTNKTQNGWTFWGLTKPARPAGDPLEALQRGWERYQRGAAAALKDGVTDENRVKLRAALDTQVEAIEALRGQVA